MEPCKDGLYVSYADHVREVAALRQALDKAIDAIPTHAPDCPAYLSMFADCNCILGELRAALQSGKEE